MALLPTNASRAINGLVLLLGLTLAFMNCAAEGFTAQEKDRVKALNESLGLLIVTIRTSSANSLRVSRSVYPSSSLRLVLTNFGVMQPRHGVNTGLQKSFCVEIYDRSKPMFGIGSGLKPMQPAKSARAKPSRLWPSQTLSLQTKFG